MDVVYSLFFRFRLLLMVNQGAFLISWKLPRRKRFWIPLVVVLALNVFFAWAWWHFFNNFGDSKSVFLQCTGFLIQYIFTFLLVILSLDCKIITALFCATCGYCMQQVVTRITDMIPMLFGVTFPYWLNILLYLLIGAVFYALCYLFFQKRNSNNKGIIVRDPIQLIIMTLALAVMVVIEQAMIPTIFAIESKYLLVANFISSIIFALLILLLEFNVLTNEEYRTEIDVLKQISKMERLQYEMEKAVIDTINIKSHDLKHQLNALGGKMDAEEMDKIKSAVDIYDSAFKTGNNALDVVLTMKSLVCKNKNIELTALLDGEKLGFIKDADIYSLFGNIIDNAIEASEKLEDEEMRVISITMFEKDSMLFVCEENYFAALPEFVNGLPQTTKSDKNYHGFGLKSINMIVSEYGGDVNINMNDGVFTLDLMFLTEVSA